MLVVNVTSGLTLAPCLCANLKQVTGGLSSVSDLYSCCVFEDILSAFFASLVVHEWYCMSVVWVTECWFVFWTQKDFALLEIQIATAPDSFLYLVNSKCWLMSWLIWEKCETLPMSFQLTNQLPPGQCWKVIQQTNTKPVSALLQLLQFNDLPLILCTSASLC